MPPACGSHPEYFLRPAALDIFRRKEAGIVLADDLFGFVPFNSLSAGVPTGNRSTPVQQVDRIVMHSIEEHLIFFFAVAKRLLYKHAPDAGLLDDPARCSHYQEAQEGCEKQICFGLAQTALCVGIT